MGLRREQVLFLATAGVCALLGWNLYNAYQNPVRRPSWQKKDREVPTVRVPDMQHFPSPMKPGANESKRDLFAAPRDTRPLPKLQIGPALPAPEPNQYAWLMPPPSPAPGIRYWHQYFRVPAAPEKFEFNNPAEGDTAEKATNNSDAANPTNTQNSSNAQNGAAPNGDNTAQAPPSQHPAAQTKPAQLDEETLAKRYDRLTLKNAPSTWGRILNPKKFDMKDEDPILFQTYDVKEGKTLGKPIERPRADVLSYQFAKTLRNEIEIKKRKVAWLPGNETKIREFGLWCLSLADEEPFAVEEAERQLKKAAVQAPKDPANMLAVGKLYETTYRYEEAWKLYRSMTDGEFQANPEAWVARAELELRLHLDKDAQSSLERAASLDGTNYHPKLVLGEFYLSLGRAPEAVSILDSAFRNEPTGVENASIRARVRRRLGEAHLAAGNLDGAADAFEKAKNADATDAGAATGAAVVLWLKKQTAPALELLNATIAAKPSAQALVARGMIKMQNKEFAAAKSDFESAIGLDPVRDVKALSALSFLYLVTDHRDEAMATIERALKNDPSDAYAHYLRGRMRRDSSDNQAAREDQKIAVMADIGFVDPLVEMGWIAAGEELYEAADRYYAKAAEFDPKNPDILALRGLNLLLWGQIRRAKDSFNSAILYQKDNALARIGLGLYSYLDDNPTAMKAELGKVRDSRPEGDKFRSFAVETLNRITIHEAKEEWTDSFDRQVFNSTYWDAPFVQGVKVRPIGGEARIENQFDMAGVSGIDCKFYKFAEFCSFEALVRIPVDAAKPEENNVDVTIYIRKFDPRAGGQQSTSLEIAITRERKKNDGTQALKYKFKDERSQNAGENSELVFPWPNDRAVTVRFEVTDDENNPTGSIILDNQIVKSGIKLPRSTAGTINFGVEASGDSGQTASVAIEAVRVVKRNLNSR